MPREIVFFIYPGFVLLDLTAPMEAFSLSRTQIPGCYRLKVVSLTGGRITSSTGLVVVSERATLKRADTLIVVGDFGLANTDVSADTIKFLRAASAKARRTASICMGAFLLAASGLLDGRQTTTHWRYAAQLQARYPSIKVNGDRIFVNHGSVWTSAGMTSGIDLSLALIAQDFGKKVAQSVARLMVVPYQRPGGQQQYSDLLELTPDCSRMQEVLAFAHQHLKDVRSVEQLAGVAGLSVRQFSRRFRTEVGTTPAKAIERLRVEAARPLVEEGFDTLDSIAYKVGYEDSNRMRVSFLRVLGQTPLNLRRNARAQVTDR